MLSTLLSTVTHPQFMAGLVVGIAGTIVAGLVLVRLFDHQFRNAERRDAEEWVDTERPVMDRPAGRVSPPNYLPLSHREALPAPSMGRQA